MKKLLSILSLFVSFVSIAANVTDTNVVSKTLYLGDPLGAYGLPCYGLAKFSAAGTYEKAIIYGNPTGLTIFGDDQMIDLYCTGGILLYGSDVTINEDLKVLGTLTAGSAIMWSTNLVYATNAEYSVWSTNWTGIGDSNYYNGSFSGSFTGDASALTIGGFPLTSFRVNQFTTNTAGTSIVGPLVFQGPLYGNGAGLSNVPSGSGTFDYLDLTNTPGIVMTNQFTTNVAGVQLLGKILSSNITSETDIQLDVGIGGFTYPGLSILYSVNAPKIIGGGNFDRTVAYTRGPAVIGGYQNYITNTVASKGSYATISGGTGNIISGVNYSVAGSFIGGGTANTIHFQGSVISGGSANTAGTNNAGANGTAYATVGGGTDNIAESSGSTVSGGEYNLARGQCSAVGGGLQNKVTDLFSFVGGGYGNTTREQYSFIGGGYVNDITDGFSFVGGGYENKENSHYSVISGGYQNISEKWSGAEVNGYNVIAGGFNNTISTNGPTVPYSGGNFAPGYGSVISGGGGNFIGAPVATICGGGENTNYGAGAVIVGGDQCRIELSSFTAFLGGGQWNTIDGCIHGVLVGGTGNKLNGGEGSFIGSGNGNLIIGAGATIYNFIGSGTANLITNSAQTFIGGGGGNLASNSLYSIISGGRYNIVTGSYGSIIGGLSNFVSGSSSVAMGKGSNATNDNTFVWSDGYTEFGSTTSNQVSMLASNGFRFIGGPIVGDGSGLTNVGSVQTNISYTAVTNAPWLTTVLPANMPNPMVTNTAAAFYFWTNATLGTALLWQPGNGLVYTNALTGAMSLLCGTNGGINLGSVAPVGAGNLTMTGTNTCVTLNASNINLSGPFNTPLVNATNLQVFYTNQVLVAGPNGLAYGTNNLSSFGLITVSNMAGQMLLGLGSYEFFTNRTSWASLGEDTIRACGTNQIITLPNATNTPVGYNLTIMSDNGYGNVIITNANGVQSVRVSSELSFKMIGADTFRAVNSGSNWYSLTRAKIIWPNAQFSCTTNIPLTTANEAYPITFDSIDFNNSQGIALGAGTNANGYNSKMWITNAGQYELTPSIVEGFTGNETVRFWFRQDNTNMLNSCTPSEASSAKTNVVTVAFVVNVTGPTAFEIWAESDSTGNSLSAQGASGNYPASPSVICPIKRISDARP